MPIQNYDVIVIGDQLEGLIIASELKKQSQNVFLVETGDDLKLKSEDSLSEDFLSENSLNNSPEIFHPLSSSSNTEALSNPDILHSFQWLLDSFYKEKKSLPFLSFSRSWSHQLKKNYRGERVQNLEVTQLEYEKNKVSSILLSNGMKLSAPLIVTSLSPRSLCKLIENSNKELLSQALSRGVFSKLSRFQAWSQVSFTFTHKVSSHFAKLSQPYEWMTFKLKELFSGGCFGPIFESSQGMRQNSYWFSLLSHDTLNDTKSLHSSILSIKKQFPHAMEKAFKETFREPHEEVSKRILKREKFKEMTKEIFKEENRENEKIFIEPESHGFLNLNFKPSFGCLSGLKNFFLASSLFSPLPPPLGSLDSAKKTLETLEKEK